MDGKDLKYKVKCIWFCDLAYHDRNPCNSKGDVM